MTATTTKDKIAAYPATDKFRVKDTIGVPHPFTIGPRHIAHASDHFSGMLGEAAIESAEKAGITCAARGCQLKFTEHKQALLIAVKDRRELNKIPELKDYLLKIKAQTEQDGFAGWAFIQE